MIQSYSWTIIDEKHAIKKTDLSVFKNHGSGIPEKIRPFFDIENFEIQDVRPIVIALNGKAYPARLVRKASTAKQTQILWNKRLSDALNQCYPDALTKKQYPEMHVFKVNEESYIFSFNDNLLVDTEENFELESKEIIGTEGKIIHVYSTKYERNPTLRKVAINTHGLKCYVCGFEFEKKYGELGKGYIEIHHRKPLCEVRGEMFVDPVSDMVCLCSNCHRMVHRKRDAVIPVEKLKEIVEANNKS